MLRVALVCPYSLSRAGGVQGQVVALASEIARLGHAVRVTAPAEEPVGVLAKRLGLEESALVVVGRSVRIPANGSVAPVALSPAATLRAVFEALRSTHDVLHLHEPFAPGPTWAYAALGRPPVVATFHRSGVDLPYRLVAPAARLLSWRFARCFAVSTQAAETARSVAGGSYEVVGNGVDIERFARARPWPVSLPTVLFAGRHEPRKGLDVLLEAFTRDRELERMGACLWVAGEGPQTGELRRRWPGSERIEWLGRIDDDEMASRMKGADVLCAPSLGGESFGVVLVEAMAAGCLVVASDIPGYREVLSCHGVLVPPGDPDELASALVRALGWCSSGQGLASDKARRERATWVARWSIRVLANRYLQAYEAVAGQSERCANSR